MHKPTSQPNLPPEALDALDRVWQTAFSQGEHRVPRRRIVEVATAVTRAARSRGMLAEELIIAIKESWLTQFDRQSIEDRHRVRLVLTHMITECIANFYPHSAERRAPDGRREGDTRERLG